MVRVQGAMRCHVGGILPRSETYMRAHWDHAKGFIDDAALAAARHEEEARHLRIQEDAGVDLLAPALVGWEDLLRPLTRCDGVEPGTLTRYFETNTFYRRPLVTAAPGPASGWLEGLVVGPAAPWALTLPSPWDFARRCEDAAGLGTEALCRAVADILRQVALDAVGKGAKVIRFHDPSALYHGLGDEDVEPFSAGLDAASRGVDAACVLHLTNGELWSHPEVVEANPLGALSVAHPGGRPPSGFPWPSGTLLTAAVVRGDDSIVEAPEAMAREAQDLGSLLGTAPVALTNDWDLDHVPHAIAARKVGALSAAAALLREEEVLA